MSQPRFTNCGSFALALTLAGMLFGNNAAAQMGIDPTRPPDALGAGVMDPNSAEAGGGMTLQSILISPTVKSAIISGVVVKLGEKYGDAVLVKVAESEVVLKSRTASQVLKLYPGVEKRESAAAAPKNVKRRASVQSRAPAAADGNASPR